ncbi:hypothetical protein SAMN05421759_103157 [Roseivivax lentus]|uniref:Sulfotransferase family protein n=1 Tax=Roseivivax lentus TaxID=633194 RepID=A0A1N7LU51_9RHOB|nr:hypothetical protein [Roseivivax lentus]SIS77304.1 hypothetical protein SAMN05421759_103157 [Roseivivax lentus]
MDIILHLGAHRSASTSFQRYMRSVGAELNRQGTGFWGPGRTRKGLFHRIDSRDARDRDRGRVQLALAGAAQRGAARLVISDENMIGTMRRNIARADLYPDIGERLARFRAAFGPVKRAHLQIRALDLYWASALAFCLPRGMPLPRTEGLQAMVQSARGWRGVIEDMAAALPETEITVTPFERFAGQPDRLLAAMTGLAQVPRDGLRPWVNRAPDLATLRCVLTDRGEPAMALGFGEGRWMPFLPDQAAALRETYQDDIYWLRAGAMGLARYEDAPEGAEPAKTGLPAAQARGPTDETDHRRLAGAG